MADQIRFRVRPVYHGSDLLVEICDDHRVAGFPNVAAVLQEALDAVQERHPENLDDPEVALSQDRYFGYWKYAGGRYEIDDDIWGLFVSAPVDNRAVIADVERALLASGKFVKEEVDFGLYK
ncbi:MULTISPECIES: hypothetical protein [Ralstonia]|jgi:hypothetical protein|uniref:Uncharacterized protein n=1 Tax=Ralstonia pickettii OR214 TaxID=1264675 RepID=R0E7F9_RALPI|nr:MULTISPECIES: hypothetical protein [Ralstonia]ENZ77347.1 hypothetical protein OR214_02971 [Ralstonia pickettii OR214]MBL4778590.1 hypothetical protein [Ralstonia sp.]MCM3579698.1 hypothetical protein [Ralstonia pickettii]MDR9385238.1 hypothetical protein [Ralstonia sp. 11b]OYU23379.1 MAG: hypothetical protein CFE42_06165 [Ralstonia sp. PBBBR1]